MANTTGSERARATLAYLRRNITMGTWPVGSRIPIEPELAEQTGMDREQAAKSLEQVLNIFGGQMAKQGGAPAPSAKPKPAGLENLLDQWK